MKRSGIQMNWCGVQHAKGRGGGLAYIKEIDTFYAIFNKINSLVTILNLITLFHILVCRYMSRY